MNGLNPPIFFNGRFVVTLVTHVKTFLTKPYNGDVVNPSNNEMISRVLEGKRRPCLIQEQFSSSRNSNLQTRVCLQGQHCHEATPHFQFIQDLDRWDTLALNLIWGHQFCSLVYLLVVMLLGDGFKYPLYLILWWKGWSLSLHWQCHNGGGGALYFDRWRHLHPTHLYIYIYILKKPNVNNFHDPKEDCT